MEPRITLLPEQLCNKIAAGEVVERPASVVKELLENSLDAGAGEILIEIEKGGKRLIRVIDDGSGMGREDTFLCLERHATSKIRSDDDLFRLSTLGFRGEALPSIAAVSRLTLRSRAAEADEGWDLYVEGGTVKRVEAAGLPRGTTVEIRDLFFNTPARRKFLRRDETELGHIGDVVTKLALSHPNVQFRLIHNGRRLIEVYRQNTLEERIAALLGRPLLRDLLTVQADGGDGLKLTGLGSRPTAGRATTGAIYTFINGRYVRDRLLQHALLDGYRHLLMKGRYPVVVLFLEIATDQVDVNVHPTKHEVRFRDQRLVHEFISASVRETLRRDSVSVPPQAVFHRTPPSAAVPKNESRFYVEPSADRDAAADRARERIQESLLAYAHRQPRPQPPPVYERSERTAEPPGAEAFPVPAAAPAEGYFSSLTYLGQYRSSYLLCQDGDDLILLDQHAAHERIGFERLKAQFSRGAIESQVLLFPSVMEFDFREAALLDEHRDDLIRFGFDLEPFGGNTYALKAVPRMLADGEAERLVRDVAGELVAVGRSALAEEALDRILITMACHGMVRANQALSPVEARALLRDLDTVDFSGHCPHGRPVVHRLTLAEVERLFKRG